MRAPRNAALLIGAALLLTICPRLAPAAETFGDWRGLWINRYEYNSNSVSSIQAKIDDAAELGVTDIMWQVRGQGDAYYQSAFETPGQSWNQAIDPLQVAIDRAHSQGIKIHAWMNSTPLWNGASGPTNPNHIFYNTDPTFRVEDINGQLEPLGNGYTKINHVIPEVQDHFNNVVNDLATNYDLDGIHLDYIRWQGPNAGSSEGYRPDWDYLPHDDQSHALYLQETGKNGADGSTFAKRQDYREWVMDRITDLVASVGDTVDAAELSTGREIKLSAAVWNNPTTAERDYLQDYRTWLEQDLLDIAMPMVYLSDNNSHLLPGFLDDIFSAPTNTEVMIGLGSYLHDNDGGGVQETLDELQYVYDDGRAAGITFYGWGSFFGSGSLGDDRLEAVNAWYDEVLKVEGDFNEDGVVDAADYTVWRDNYLAFGPGNPADANGDNVVSKADHAIWAANYGGAAALGTANSVPEPSAVLLAAATFLTPCLLARRRG